MHVNSTDLKGLSQAAQGIGATLRLGSWDGARANSVLARMDEAIDVFNPEALDNSIPVEKIFADYARKLAGHRKMVAATQEFPTLNGPRREVLEDAKFDLTQMREVGRRLSGESDGPVAVRGMLEVGA